MAQPAAEYCRQHCPAVFVFCLVVPAPGGPQSAKQCPGLTSFEAVIPADNVKTAVRLNKRLNTA